MTTAAHPVTGSSFLLGPGGEAVLSPTPDFQPSLQVSSASPAPCSWGQFVCSLDSAQVKWAEEAEGKGSMLPTAVHLWRHPSKVSRGPCLSPQWLLLSRLSPYCWKASQHVRVYASSSALPGLPVLQSWQLFSSHRLILCPINNIEEVIGQGCWGAAPNLGGDMA